MWRKQAGITPRIKNRDYGDSGENERPFKGGSSRWEWRPKIASTKGEDKKLDFYVNTDF